MRGRSPAMLPAPMWDLEVVCSWLSGSAAPWRAAVAPGGHEASPPGTFSFCLLVPRCSLEDSWCLRLAPCASFEAGLLRFAPLPPATEQRADLRCHPQVLAGFCCCMGMAEGSKTCCGVHAVGCDFVKHAEASTMRMHDARSE
jgi:hypothetical protein